MNAGPYKTYQQTNAEEKPLFSTFLLLLVLAGQLLKKQSSSRKLATKKIKDRKTTATLL
jgi:hypothetical protein